MAFKFGGIKGQDLGILAGGLAALAGGPLSLLAIPAFYKSMRDEQDARDADERSMFAENALLTGRMPAGQDPRTGIAWNEQRAVDEGELPGLAAQAGGPAGARLMKSRLDQVFPEPEQFGTTPVEGLDESGNAVLGLPGQRGGFKALPVRPMPREDKGPGARGWFKNIRTGKIFQGYENAPGIKQGLATGEFELAQEPDKTQMLGLGEQYARIFGAQVPAGHMPEVDNGRLTGRTTPIPGGPQDPRLLKQRETAERQQKLAAEAPGAKAKMDSALGFYDNMLAQIAKIEANPEWKDVVGSIEGRDSMFGGATALDQGESTALTDIDTLNNMLQVQGLQTMRDESKTGGAVGSVTEREWPKLSSRYGNLDRRQGEGSFAGTLSSLKKDLLESRGRIENAYFSTYAPREQAGRTAAQSNVFGGGQPQGAAALPQDIPPPEQRQQGRIYQTPRGPMVWAGDGWLPAQGIQ